MIFGVFPDRFGVYRYMRAGWLLLLCLQLAWAQNLPVDPIMAKRDAVWKARREGRFAEAAAHREEARALLRTLPASDPAQFQFWAVTVAQLYQQGGRTAEARAVAEEALAMLGK